MVAITWLHTCAHPFTYSIVVYCAVVEMLQSSQSHSQSWIQPCILNFFWLAQIKDSCFCRMFLASPLFIWLLIPWSTKNLQGLYIIRFSLSCQLSSFEVFIALFTIAYSKSRCIQREAWWWQHYIRRKRSMLQILLDFGAFRLVS